MAKPEQEARVIIDRLLEAAGWLGSCGPDRAFCGRRIVALFRSWLSSHGARSDIHYDWPQRAVRGLRAGSIA
jgi:hypothetical protein